MSIDRKYLRPLAIAVLLVAVVLTAIFLPLEQILNEIQQWSNDNRRTAIFIVGAFIIVGVLLMLPASLMMMLAGFLFGVVKGFAVVWVAGLIASTIAFWLGQSIARPWIERRIRRKSIFLAIDRAIQRKGFLVVLLTRLVMVLPYPALNYSLGLTGVRLRDYVLGTNIGMVPPIFLMVYLGTTVSNVAAIMSGDVTLEGREMMIAIAALLVVLAVIAAIVRVAAKVLKEELVAAEE